MGNGLLKTQEVSLIYFKNFPIDLALEKGMIISEQWCDYF